MNETILLWTTLFLFVLLIGYTFIWRKKELEKMENAAYKKTPERKAFEQLSWLRDQINTQPMLQSRKDFEKAKREVCAITNMRIRNIFEQDIDEIACYLAIRSEKQTMKFPITVKGTMYATLARVNEAYIAKDIELARKYYMQARKLFPRLNQEEKKEVAIIMKRIEEKIEQ